MLYTDRVIEDVRSANDIVGVISSRVKLVKKGKYFFGLCPFHNEKTPSFSVDQDRQMYYCYSCNKGGDAYKFLMETERLSFPEAIQRLADMANIVLPESSDPVYNSKISQAKERQKRQFEMHGQAVSFFSQNLISDAGKAARAYMQKRVIRADIVRRFNLGYALPDWDKLYEFLRSKGYSDDDIMTGGLALKGKNGGFYDRFRHRIMFPIQDASGRVIAFGGRTLDDSVPKYLNSPETPLYSKGKNLYGLNLAKNSKEKRMIIVEGYMDLIALSSHGIDNVVAPLGTALTETQARLLKRYTDEVIIAFDADGAGQAAALRGLDILENQGFRVKVLTIPDLKDPDDFVKTRGAAAFRELADAAKPLLDYKISYIRSQNPAGEANGDVQFFKGVVRVLAEVGDEIEREIYIGRIAEQYNISVGAIKTEIGKALNNRAAQAGPNGADRGAYAVPGGAGRGAYAGLLHGAAAAITAGTQAQPSGIAAMPGGYASMPESPASNVKKNGAADKDEFFVIALLSIDNSLWDIVTEKLPLEQIENLNIRQALAYACERASQGKTTSPGDLMWFFPSEESDKFAQMVTKGCHCEDNRRAMEQKIKMIQTARAKRQMYEILRELGDKNLPEDDVLRLKKQLSRVNAQM